MFGIVTINAREIEIQADEVIEEDGAYKFYSEGGAACRVCKEQYSWMV